MKNPKNTSDFYQAHYHSYHQRTFSVDAALFLEPFVKYLSPGATVLDVGCGSGRDLVWLKQRGFAVLGFERSDGLAALARKNAGCRVICGDFETFDFSRMNVDAVLMSGSLVHVPHTELPSVLTRILCAGSLSSISRPAKKTPTHAFISLKEGIGSKTFADGRVFYLWEKETVAPIFEQLGLTVLETVRNLSPLRPDEVWLAFVVSL